MRATARARSASSSSGGSRPRRLGRLAGGAVPVLVTAALVSGALVVGSGGAASADSGDGICTVTLQLPATAESGQPFSMEVVEDGDCAGGSGLEPFSVSELAAPPLRFGYPGIEFTHTPGTGDASYTGTAPNPGVWRPRVSSGGRAFGYISHVDLGYELEIGAMETTPQVTVAQLTPPARAVWVNRTLRITYPHVSTVGGPGGEQSWRTFVDGKQVLVEDHDLLGSYGSVEVARAASAGPAEVEIVGISDPDSYPARGDTQTIIYSRTIAQQVVKASRGQVSAAALLDELRVGDEAHKGSYSRSEFAPWIDADHDGEDTRAEVLKAESRTAAKVDRRGRVTAGRWTSPYDGKVITDPARLAIDRLVPLEEAWTSGGSAWSKRRRTAYANDVGYGPSLIAVSRTARRAKGDEEITGHLPANTSYRCTYARNWIAVKHRWGLAVDPVEKNMLDSDLTLYCTDLYVTAPSAPNLAALVARPRR